MEDVVSFQCLERTAYKPWQLNQSGLLGQSLLFFLEAQLQDSSSKFQI